MKRCAETKILKEEPAQFFMRFQTRMIKLERVLQQLTDAGTQSSTGTHFGLLYEDVFNKNFDWKYCKEIPLMKLVVRLCSIGKWTT